MKNKTLQKQVLPGKVEVNMEKTETAAQANVSIHNKCENMVGEHGREGVWSHISSFLSVCTFKALNFCQEHVVAQFVLLAEYILKTIFHAIIISYNNKLSLS